MTAHALRTGLPAPSRTRHHDRGRKVVGGIYLSTGGIHLGIVAADTDYYRTFADTALFGFVRTGWAEVFMAAPTVWGLALFLGETLIGLMLLGGGRWTRPGWAAVIAFHLCLVLFGWGFLLWVVPALAVVLPLAAADLRRGATTGR